MTNIYINIENYKSIKNLTISSDKNSNILYASNSIGKTTISNYIIENNEKNNKIVFKDSEKYTSMLFHYYLIDTNFEEFLKLHELIYILNKNLKNQLKFIGKKLDFLIYKDYELDYEILNKFKFMENIILDDKIKLNDFKIAINSFFKEDNIMDYINYNEEKTDDIIIKYFFYIVKHKEILKENLNIIDDIIYKIIKNDIEKYEQENKINMKNILNRYKEILKNIEKSSAYNAIKIFDNIFIDQNFYLTINEKKSDFFENFKHLSFNIKDSKTKKNRDEKELSESERQRIYYFYIILQIEYWKDKYIVFIFDDIIDTLDNLNQLSLCYYFKILEQQNIKFLLMTHNYYFFKLLANKLRDPYLIHLYKNENNKEESHIVDILTKNNIHFDLKSHLKNIKNYYQYFLLLCYIRDVEQKKLKIDIFHIKNVTKEIILKEALNNYDLSNIDINLEKNYYTTIFEEADKINSEDGNDFYNLISLKVTIALCIRLKMEEKIINFFKNLNNEHYIKEINSIKSNQTTKLITIYNDYKKEKTDLTKFDIASSNIIHLNSGFYEIILFYNLSYLINLYKEIKEKEL